MGNKIRAKYVKQFYEDVSNELLDSFPEIWQFLDAVLDDSFEKLKVMLQLPDRRQPDSKVIDAIARRCPGLKTLLLNFSVHLYNSPELDEAKQVIWSLSSLSHLSKLALYLSVDRKNVTPLLRVVSKSCPILSRLYWEELFFAQETDVLALVLGDLVRDPDLKEKEAEWSEDEVLQSLRVPPNCVSPLCSTLQHVHLGSYCTPASLVFLLRHMPLLKTLDGARENLAEGILLFQNAPTLEGIQEEFDELCTKGARLLERRPLRPVSSLIPLTSSGPLSLITLDLVSLSSADVLRAVGNLCPSLNDVHFGDNPSISPDELESILFKWPKLESITVGAVRSRVDPVFMRSILKVFAPDLKKLHLHDCGQTPLADLKPCFKVEALTITGENCFALNSQLQKATEEEAITFLPKLKNFQQPKN